MGFCSLVELFAVKGLFEVGVVGFVVDGVIEVGVDGNVVLGET